MALGGVAVCDGDIVLGDEDGVAIIPRDRAEEITALAEAKAAAEAEESAAISAGTWDRQWIDKALNVIEVPRVY